MSVHDVEYCRKVAGVVGIDPFYGDDGVAREFRPDVDWNDAMWAAERFGLFSKHCVVLDDTGVFEPGGHPDLCDDYLAPSDGLSPKAICEAILKLKAANTD